MNLNRDASHYVYRLYDADDRLLYIGCSNDPDARIYQHACWGRKSGQLAEIGPLLHHWTYWRYPDKASAHAAEVAAIGSEAPVFNTRHTHSPQPSGWRYQRRFRVADLDKVIKPAGDAA